MANGAMVITSVMKNFRIDKPTKKKRSLGKPTIGKERSTILELMLNRRM